MSRDLKNIDPSKCNVLFLVCDSCRYDTAKMANTPFLDSIGELRRALSHSDYTLPSHMAMFEGRLPSVEEEPLLPLYTDSIRQLWRVSPHSFFETKSKSEIAITLVGDNIIEGYSKLGYFTLGAASLNYFTKGRAINGFFDKFLDYYDISEGAIGMRPLKGFPLIHVDEIVSKIKNHEKWFLFVNSKETHYPYDVGDGYSEKLIPLMKKMQRHLNLRRDKEELTAEESRTLKELQVFAIEKIDERLGKLVDALPKNRPILVVVCADHGDSFGEKFYGISRCGHLHPSPEVMQVPLVIGLIEK